MINESIERRALLRAGAWSMTSLALANHLPAWAQSGSPGLRPDMPTLTGEDIRLTIGQRRFAVGGRTGEAIMMNDVLPAPLIRLREGQNVRIHVQNELDEDASIHWHGLILPFQMDGVPGISFPGIKARSSFTYDFPIVQSGTYWYHGHSGLHEQLGQYGPMIFDPAEPDPVAYDREHVVILSDWTFMPPHRLFARLKQQSGFFNRQKLTLLGRLSGEDRMSPEERDMFARMRMDPTDISDVSAAAYTYLVNGHGPEENWTGLFCPGERVRLRFINAATQTIFNLRIPGLPMRVVNADGQNVRPVTVDELQIGNGETYDAIVQPGEDRAYTIVAETIDRSGMGRATLAPRLGMTAEVPPLRKRPLLTMADMGMGAMDHGGGHAGHGGAASSPSATGHAGMDMRDKSKVPFEVGVGVDMIAPDPVDRTDFPGIGLEDVGHKALTYRDLASLKPRKDDRPPARTIEIHLTGNMERFMWSMDGKKLSEAPEPYRFARNEWVRMVLINDTMMTHPMHLHGMLAEVVNGHGDHHPLKHTYMVMPGAKLSLDLTADAPGDWAFHCHLLYHMHAGMFRIATVRPLEGGEA